VPHGLRTGDAVVGRDPVAVAWTSRRNHPPARASAEVIVVPESRGIFPGLTVDDNLTLRLKSAAERTEAYERYPVLGERRNLRAGSLSGGEQADVGARHAVGPPTGGGGVRRADVGLAPMIVDQVLEIFVELRRRGVALLLVEEKSKRFSPSPTASPYSSSVASRGTAQPTMSTTSFSSRPTSAASPPSRHDGRGSHRHRAGTAGIARLGRSSVAGDHGNQPQSPADPQRDERDGDRPRCTWRSKPSPQMRPAGWSFSPGRGAGSARASTSVATAALPGDDARGKVQRDMAMQQDIARVIPRMRAHATTDHRGGQRSGGRGWDGPRAGR